MKLRRTGCLSGSQSRWTSGTEVVEIKEKGEKKKMKIISAVVYKPQLQTALEKKTADVFCKNLKKRSGVSLLQSKTSGKISIEFYKEDRTAARRSKRCLTASLCRAKGLRIRVIDNPDGSGRIVVLGKDERGEFYGMARLLRKAIVKKGRH